MDAQRLIKILVHPLFLGSIITVIIALAFMPEILKYKIAVIEKQNTSETTHTLYADLDRDRIFERIRIHDNPMILSLMINSGKVFIEQYNLRSKPVYPDFFHVDDYNADGSAELYLITTRNDSIFLSIIDPLVQKKFILRERLIYYNDTIAFGDEYPMSRFVGLLAHENQAEKDVVFAFQAGFSKQPRNFFRYNIKKDELRISPLSGATYGYIFTEDLDADSNPEIYFTTMATGNHEPGFPYTDQSAWLMVLDQDLEYVFEPLEFPRYPTTLVVTPFIHKDSSYIVAVHHYSGTEPVPSSLNLFDPKGKKLLSRPVPQVDMIGYNLSTTKYKGQAVISLIDASNDKVSYLNLRLEEIRSFSIPGLKYGWMMDELDLDFDGTREKIFHGRNQGSFVIFRENLRHGVVADFGEKDILRHLSPFLEDGHPRIYAQFQTSAYVLSYRTDPLYYLKYPLLLIFYLAVSLIIYLIFRLQKYRAERDYQAQRKMNELQILSLKNQIEPHFTFNILNAIGSLYTRGADPDRAYDIFVKYANLLRFTIQNSDKVSIPIKEELDFVNTYVDLEQFRSGQAFEYRTDMEESADLSTKIPRMLIHTFVENAIKHGIRLIKENALLELKITRNKHTHEILIRDNGPGPGTRQVTGPGSQASQAVQSTGKGLRIVDEMLDLFYQLEGVRISYSLEDSSMRDPELQGTEVLITVPG